MTPNEAVNIIKRLDPPTFQQGYSNGQYNTSYQPQQTQYTNQIYNQPYNPQQPQYNPQPYNPSPQYMPIQQQQAAPTTIDPNTLNLLYSLLQKSTAAPVVQTPAFPTTTASMPAVSQPSIPQLLATLMSGLNMSKGSPVPNQALPQQQVQTNNNLSVANTTTTYSSPTVPATAPVHTNNVSKPAVSLDQPSIAALLSTASNGNPALAQLLQQMTASVTNTAQPRSPVTASNQQLKSEYTPSR